MLPVKLRRRARNGHHPQHHPISNLRPATRCKECKQSLSARRTSLGRPDLCDANTPSNGSLGPQPRQMTTVVCPHRQLNNCPLDQQHLNSHLPCPLRPSSSKRRLLKKAANSRLSLGIHLDLSRNALHLKNQVLNRPISTSSLSMTNLLHDLANGHLSGNISIASRSSLTPLLWTMYRAAQSTR